MGTNSDAKITKLEEVRGTPNLNRADLKVIETLLKKSTATAITTDVLEGVRKAVTPDFGEPSTVQRRIIQRVEGLLRQREAFRFKN